MMIFSSQFRMVLVTSLLVASVGCYRDLDYSNIKCDITATPACPDGLMCSAGLCVKAPEVIDGSSAETGTPSSLDVASVDQGGEATDVSPTAIDAGAVDMANADFRLSFDVQTMDATVDASGVDQRDDDAALTDLADAVPVVIDTGVLDVSPVVDTAPIVDTTPTRTWSSPVKVQPDQDTYATAHSVAMDPVSGNAVVAWSDLSQGVTAALYNAATDNWGQAVSVSTDADLDLATVAADAKGHYVLVWSKRGDGTDATSPGIWASFSTGGATWSTPVQLWAGGAKNWDDDIQIAMNRNGQASVIWAHSESPVTSDSPPDKLYSVYIDGTANQPATLVATWPSADVNIYARVAIDGSGNGLIVWVAPDTTVAKQSIWAVTFVKQTLGTPALVENYDSGDADLPTVAMNAAGQGIVVWSQDTATATEVYGRRYSVTGSWAGSSDLVNRANASDDMSVALDGYGTANLVLSKANNIGYQATYLAQAVGETWSNASSLESDDLAQNHQTWSNIDPQVAVDTQGNVLVGWRKKTGDNEFVPHLRWRFGGTWGQDIETGKVLDMFANDMRIAVSDDGRAIAAWSYYHCYPDSTYASTRCPTAKADKDVSATSWAASGSVYAVVYR
jgi:hypothetical protein